MSRMLLARSPFIEVSESTFHAAKNAREKLLEALAIEEKFNLLLRNYEEFEVELLRVALDGSLYFNSDWSASRGTFYEVARRMVNMLSACRLYIDQVKHNISGIYGSGSEQATAINQRCSLEYHAHLGYRVMEQLRNYVQHRGLPIGGLTWSSSRVEETKATRKHIRVTTVLTLKVSDLREDARFSASILEELAAIGEEPEMKPLVRDYLVGIGGIQEEVRKTIAADVGMWERVIEDLIAQYEKEGGADITMLAVVRREGRAFTEHVPLFRDVITRRRSLESRNSRTGRYERMVVTNY